VLSAYGSLGSGDDGSHYEVPSAEAQVRICYSVTRKVCIFSHFYTVVRKELELNFSVNDLLSCFISNTASLRKVAFYSEIHFNTCDMFLFLQYIQLSPSAEF